MKIGITLGHVGDTVQDTVRFAVQAEQAGLPIIGMGDVPSVFREAYGLLMACALATSKVQLGPTVTNPVIRHPYITASSIATIDEASGGRAFVVIGTGNASVRNLNLPKATIADLEAAARMIRTGFVESAAKDDGARSRTEQRQSPLEWPTRVVPLYVAAGTGLRSLKVAADYADGVMLHTVPGNLPLARRRVEQLKELRAAGPRAGDPLEVWLYSPGWVSDSPEECRTVLGSIVTGSLGIFDFSRAVEGVDEDLAGRLRAFQQEYSYSSHASHSAQVNVDLMEKHGVTDFLFGRVAVYGSHAEVAKQLADLEDAGVQGAFFSGAIPDKPRLISALGDLQRELDARTPVPA